MFGTGAAAPAFEVLSGDLAMGGNNITGLDHVNGNDASQLSFLGNSIEQKDITNGTIRGKDLDDSIAGNCLNFAPLPVGRVMELTQNCVDNGHVVDNGLDNSSLMMNEGYTFDFVSLKTALEAGNLSLGDGVRSSSGALALDVLSEFTFQSGQLDLAQDAVHTGEIASGGVTEFDIKNANVTSADLRDPAVKRDDIFNNAVRSSHIAANQILGEAGATDHIKDNTIDDLDVVNDGLDSSSLKTGAVGGAELSNTNVVNSSHVVLGDGLTDTGSDGSIDVQAADSTISVLSSGLDIARGGIGALEIVRNGVNSTNLDMGSGLVDSGSDGTVDVRVDGSTITIGGSGLQVVAGGIGGNQIATGAVTGAELSNTGIVNRTHISPGSITEAG
ncbi:MAG: hypothetical protein SVU32_00130, partial [Candidatus Nanohaloarchaea archaeon]|nr:hypothetical protein [Candidatus Nanohaloarchaea archaeon]